MVAGSEMQRIRVNIDPGELPGILCTSDLIVTFVQRSGALEDRIAVGDKILQVNDQNVIDRTAFLRIQRKYRITRLTVNRDKGRGEKIKQDQQVDDKKITKRDGFLYLRVKMTQPKPGAQLGLALKNGSEGSVYVTHVLHGSASSECLVVGDRILQIDGTSIDDKEVARKAIIKGFSSGSIILIVERPDSPAARNIAAEVLAVRTPPCSDKA